MLLASIVASALLSERCCYFDFVLEGGRLYITTPNAPTRNYCALPTGQAIAPLPIDLRDDYVLAIGRTGRTLLLFQVTRTTLRTPTISEVRIPAPCR